MLLRFWHLKNDINKKINIFNKYIHPLFRLLGVKMFLFHHHDIIIGGFMRVTCCTPSQWIDK